METLQATIDELRRENADLRDQLAAALKENRELRERLEQLERAVARQAAPFRRRESKKIPPHSKKRPGRPPGHQGTHRAVPTQIDEQIEVPLVGCPHCSGPVTDVQPVEQFIEEIPPVRAHVTRLVTYRGCCAACGEVSSTHPLQA